MIENRTTNNTNISQALLLINEMTQSVQHVATLVDNMIQKVQSGELTTDQGLSFLEMKYNMLLSYLINLTFVVLKKSTGHTIEGDPCIDRLVEIRTVLEKIKPINYKLKYQIDKLVKTSIMGTNDNDPTSFKPNPELLMDQVLEPSDDEQHSDADKPKKSNKSSVGIYVPPKFSATHYVGDEKDINKKIQEGRKKKAISSAILQDLKEEYLDTPVEISQGSKAHHAISKQQQERQHYEEEYLTRLPTIKSEKNKLKQFSTLGALGNEITDFGITSVKRKQSSIKTKKKNLKRRKFH